MKFLVLYVSKFSIFEGKLKRHNDIFTSQQLVLNFLECWYNILWVVVVNGSNYQYQINNRRLRCRSLLVWSYTWRLPLSG